MAGTLPSLTTCCDPCSDPQVVEVPGPQGDVGAAGAAGTNGANAFTTFTANFTMPAELASDVATVADTSWIAVNQILYAAKADGSVIGYFQATAIGGATSVTLKNLEDSGTGAYPSNSAPGQIFTSGSKLCPGGMQGVQGASGSGAAGGDLKGTYPNPKLSVANALGAIPVGNGTDTTAVAAGTNGYLITYDSTQPNGIRQFKPLPLTADANVADNRIPRLDRPLGTEVPSPLQSSLMGLTDNGALQIGYGNAKGTDAVDLQASHTAVTQVASGQEATIAGGRRNTASGIRSTIAGGDTSVASGQESAIGGGSANLASGDRSVVGGGDTNAATGQEATISGGNANIAEGIQSFIGGGDTNWITGAGDESVIGGGKNNAISGSQALIGGGEENDITAKWGAIAGGKSNVVVAVGGAVVGGIGASAYLYGQIAHANGLFVVAGDSQASWLNWRVTTTDATANVEMFLDGVAEIAAIPSGRTWAFEILLCGRSSAGVSAAWKVEGAIQNNGGTTSLVAAVTTTVIADGTGGTWGLAANFTVDANNANDSLRLRVTGAAATTIRWLATARLTEVANS